MDVLYLWICKCVGEEERELCGSSHVGVDAT